jgi:hypothetical protein
LTIAVVVFILYQLDKRIRLDDDLIGEQVYFLLNKGYVKSEMMRGYGNLMLEVHQTIFHKLFVYWGALVCKLFGWSLYSLHASSLLFLLFFVFALYRFLRTQRALFFFTLIFILTCYNVLYFSNCFRPEMMLMTFGFLGYAFIDRYLSKGKKADLFFSALCSALAFSTHPHGVIYCVAGGMLLLLNRNFLTVIIFGTIVSFVFFAFYFSDIVYWDQYDLFAYQLRNDPIINVHDHHWYTPLVKLFEEHIRIFFNEREIIITALLVTGIVFSYKKLIRTQKNLVLYGLSCFVSLGALTYSKSPQYLLLYLPFTVLIIGHSWKIIEEGSVRYKKQIYRTLLVAFAGIHVFFSGKKIVENCIHFREPSLAAANHLVAGHIPAPHDSMSLLSYDSFIFDEIKNFRRIQTLTVYSFFTEQQYLPKKKLPELVAAARKDSIDYMVFNESYIKYFEITAADLENAQHFKVQYQDDATLILCLKP